MSINCTLGHSAKPRVSHRESVRLALIIKIIITLHAPWALAVGLLLLVLVLEVLEIQYPRRHTQLSEPISNSIMHPIYSPQD